MGGDVDPAKEREKIRDALETMDDLEKLRELQVETLAKLKRLLRHKYLWPKGFAGGTSPKYSFTGGNPVTFTMTREDGESKSFVFKVRKTVLKQGWRDKPLPENTFLHKNRPVTLTILEPKDEDIPVEYFADAVMPWVDHCMFHGTYY